MAGNTKRNVFNNVFQAVLWFHSSVEWRGREKLNFSTSRGSTEEGVSGFLGAVKESGRFRA